MIRISANVYYRDIRELNAELCLDELFYVSTLVDSLLGTKKCWYEKGYSRKKALEHVVFNNGKAASEVIKRWCDELGKEKPLIITGIWDGEIDNKVCSINYIRKHISNPEKIMLDISITSDIQDINTDGVIDFFASVLRRKDISYALINTNGYWNNEENVFPDRVCVGWMAYIPMIILPELIPEAERVIPLMSDGSQKGTIILSTEDIFDGRNKNHIGKANDLEIKLLDLGLLPLMTEL